MKLTGRGSDFISEASLKREPNSRFEAMTGMKPMTFNIASECYKLGFIEVDCHIAELLNTETPKKRRDKTYGSPELN